MPGLAEVTWTVTLANKKAWWHQFAGAAEVAQVPAGDPAAPPAAECPCARADRQRLIVGPSAATVAGRGQVSRPLAGQFAVLLGGGFTTPVQNVYLGELRTDDDGRLLVLVAAARPKACFLITR